MTSFDSADIGSPVRMTGEPHYFPEIIRPTHEFIFFCARYYCPEKWGNAILIADRNPIKSLSVSLGITPYQAVGMCQPHNFWLPNEDVRWFNEKDDMTPENAAKMLRNFVKTGYVVWGEMWE